MDWQVADFLEVGVTAVQVFEPEELPAIQKRFLRTLQRFPEYLRDTDDIVYVLGGFAALGNPASFHNELVRDIRSFAFDAAKPFFQQLARTSAYREKWDIKGGQGTRSNKTKVNKNRVKWVDQLEPYYLQELPDRMMYRLKGQSPTAEAWHRDIMPKKDILPGDDIFGGWVNLDSESQFFSCIPGSHAGLTLESTAKSGFATLAEEVPDEEERNEITAERQLFEVEPGQMIIFPQYILHEVVANKAKRNMMRLFTGWRLTHSPDSMLYSESVFEDQGIFRLPGGMLPPMYAMNHLMMFKNRAFNIGNGEKKTLLEWSVDTFVPEALEEKVGSDGMPYIVVQRYMDSLAEMGLPLYVDYSEEEMEIYRGVLLD